jgi:hypothetical protein
LPEIFFHFAVSSPERLKSRPEKFILEIMQEPPAKSKYSAVYLLKRFGFWGFMFFLVKGLLWLIVPAIIAYFAW